ncbi:hypothetical protein [Arthrobacter psychrochitiniphilus]|uniref:Uncharacterized protein n=1 Tax=Arthrobacter psychrochitiniphilus TaxID=291045 RepID=A0A2V3DVW4_9MICC|nr:hypothetical protein [Arthrobacter psychrochitiniphilus]NYG16396.1 chromate transport protein ChrA [Arthrobacter psychrochitiniphilus]PXA69451.1 hypothetical protein CVS29_02570 [Arthrobacter psychrochitiniphilus]
MTENSRLEPTPNERVKQERSQLTGTLVALIGWAVVVVPIILMAVFILAAVLEPSQSMASPARLALIFGGAVLLFCMIAAPHLLGQAVRFKERAMWRAALLTGIPTVCVILYFVFRWLSNLG